MNNTRHTIRVLLWILPILVCFTRSEAQDFRQKVDQNLRLLQDSSDTIRFNAMRDLATFYNFLPDKSDSVNYYAQEALQLANKSDVVAWKMVAYYYKSLFHQRYSLDFDSALVYLTQLESLILESGNTDKLGATYNALGNVWNGKGDYGKALEYYKKVANLAKEDNDIVSLTNATANTASLYRQMGENEKAIVVMHEALNYNAQDTTPDQINSYLTINLNLLEIYIGIDSLEAAKLLMDKIAEQASTADYPVFRQRFVNNQLRYFEKIKDEDALQRLASENYQSIRNANNINPQIYNTVSYYYGLGLAKKGKTSEVREIITDLKSRNVNEMANFSNMKNLYIYELGKSIGDFETALEYHERYHELEDSLKGDEKTERIQELFAQYEVEKRERKLQEVENEKLKLRRNVTALIAALLGLTAAASLYYLWSYRKRQREKEEIYNIEQKMLSLQMNPHFIFNAISSIQNYLFDEGDTRKALRHLSTFSNLMRQILENSREKFISLEDEIQFLTNYLKLQKLRYDDRFDYEIIVDPSIDVERVSIPPLLTQPFVENAIEHGDLHTVENGKIIITMKVREQQLHIEIDDNGIGIEEARKKSKNVGNKKSLAIKITQERLDLLNKLMKNKFSMKIDSKEKVGTSVQLRIPTIYL